MALNGSTEATDGGCYPYRASARGPMRFGS
jgi:hypothetical protein